MLRKQTSWSKLINVELKPIYLGGIMNRSKNQPPGLNQLKAQYMNQDIKYLRQFFDVKNFALPYNLGTIIFSRSTIDAQRILLIIKNFSADEEVAAASEAFYDHIWSTDGKSDVSANLETFLQVLRSSKCISENTLNHVLETLQSPEEFAKVKQKLINETNEAVDKYGIFGAPSFVFSESDDNWELYFGADRLIMLAALHNLPLEGIPALAKL